MKIATASEKRLHSLFIIYIFTFIVTLHFAIPAYINSSFLVQFTTEQIVGLIYTAASILSIIAFLIIPKILNRFGNYKTTLGLLMIEIAALAGMATWSKSPISILLFIISFVVLALIGFTLDIFVEHFSRDKTTGHIRGIFMTTANVAWVLSPLAASFILGSANNYSKIFWLGCALLIPAALIIKIKMNGFIDDDYSSHSLWKTLREVRKNRNLTLIFFISFLLQFFYAWMVIYTPIFLHEHLNFSWSEIGIIFSVMLLPFIFIELPLGRLADTKWGEKEALAIGFVIMAISTAAMGFVASPTVMVWAVILFITRIGASMVEIMSETYFFKKISTENANIISGFRTMRPLAYIMSPVIGSAAIFFVPFQGLFVILGAIMFTGLFASLKIKDTL